MLYLFHIFSYEYEDIIGRLTCISITLSLFSIFWGAFHATEDYPGFFKSVVTIIGGSVVIISWVFEIHSVLTWAILAYVLYFPAAVITYFVIQGYEVRRSGGH
jgi:hypothetical protein